MFSSVDCFICHLIPIRPSKILLWGPLVSGLLLQSCHFPTSNPFPGYFSLSLCISSFSLFPSRLKHWSSSQICSRCLYSPPGCLHSASGVLFFRAYSMLSHRPATPTPCKPSILLLLHKSRCSQVNHMPSSMFCPVLKGGNHDYS